MCVCVCVCVCLYLCACIHSYACIHNLPAVAFACSGDEDDHEEPIDWLPIAPEIEDPEEAG